MSLLIIDTQQKKHMIEWHSITAFHSYPYTDSNGEAVARIPLKINIYFILATHNNTPSYKQKQSAEGAFLVEELSAARRRKAHTTKKNAR